LESLTRKRPFLQFGDRSAIVFLAVLLVSPELFAGETEITILHTNDLHSHVLGFSPNIDYRPDMTGADATKGGWARILHAAKAKVGMLIGKVRMIRMPLPSPTKGRGNLVAPWPL
jgi:hypothetical protein